MQLAFASCYSSMFMLPKVQKLQKKYDDSKVECEKKDATNHSLVKELQKLQTDLIKV